MNTHASIKEYFFSANSTLIGYPFSKTGHQDSSRLVPEQLNLIRPALRGSLD